MRLLDGTGLWVRRYGVQHLAAELALVATALLLAGAPPLRVGLVCAAAEALAFYGVAYLRLRSSTTSRRRTALALLAEYGPAELADLALRPLLVAAGASLALPSPIGVAAGSAVADLLFYGVAALLGRRPYRAAPRSSRSTRASSSSSSDCCSVTASTSTGTTAE